MFRWDCVCAAGGVCVRCGSCRGASSPRSCGPAAVDAAFCSALRIIEAPGGSRETGHR